MRLPAIWSDHAIIQRNKPIVVWGWCDTPRVMVHATLGPVSAQAPSSWDGRFMLRLPPLSAGGPLELRVTCGKEECVCRDLHVGEVWLVSGQSNAEFPLMTFTPEDPLDQTPQYLQEGGEDPLLRCFTTFDDALVNWPDQLPPGSSWQLSSKETAPAFTAIGAWFALFHRKHFPEVPVGIVHSSWGGTPVCAWTSRETLARRPENRAMLEADDLAVYKKEAWKNLGTRPSFLDCICEDTQRFEDITQKDPGNKGFALGYAREDFDDSQWKTMTIPGSWLTQKISTHGSLWVRREVTIPPAWANQPLMLNLGGVDKHDITYFNGVQVGATGKDFDTQYWLTPRHYPIPAELVKPGRNVVAIRAYCFLYDAAFTGGAHAYSLKNPATGETIPLADIPWKAWPEYAFVPQGGRQEAFNPVCDSHAPHRLYENKILPLVPFPIRGVLWYQGETDADREETTDLYAIRFRDLIEDWRHAWGQGEDFPFYYVQLANYQASHPENWLKIQDAQRRVFLDTPETGVITATDLALFEPLDIHPHDKRSFGHRLFQLALRNLYGDTSVIPQGPTLDGTTREGQTLRLHFRYGEGLCAKDGQPLRGFEMAGADGVLHPAQATLQGEEILLSSPQVPHPTLCQYNGKVDLPEGNLVNRAGLPALSFRQEVDETP